MTTAALVVWTRPEYEGREDELVNQNDIALLAGVTRAAVSNWAVRHDDFPDVVATVGTAPTAPRLYVRSEVDDFLQERSEQPRRRRKEPAPARSTRDIWTDKAERAVLQVDVHQQRVNDLYRELGKATARLKRAEANLATARSKIAELD